MEASEYMGPGSRFDTTVVCALIEILRGSTRPAGTKEDMPNSLSRQEIPRASLELCASVRWVSFLV